MGGTDEDPHALVVPSSGQGHISGCMRLARALAALGFKVTFIYFSSYYAKLKAINRLQLPSSHPERSTNIHFSNGSGAETFSQAAANSSTIRNGSPCSGLIQVHVVEDGFQPGDIDKHFFVTPAMKENLFNLILQLRDQGSPPTCVVSDSFVPWTLHVAQRTGIPRIDFWTSNAMSYLFVMNFPTLVSQGIFPEKGCQTQWKGKTSLMLDIPGLPPFSSEIFPKHLRFSDSSNPYFSFFSEVAACVKYGERTLIHTMSEVEPDAFRALQVAGVPAYGVGPLFQYVEEPEAGSTAVSEPVAKSGVSQLNGQVDCISWLNLQADSSVIYVAFGSFASLSVEEIRELAFGLEVSGTPFLWVVREDSHGGSKLTEVLPDGFLERVSERGMIIGWAPQVQVLAHKAVGGFLTHCGWNSALESLWEGVPMLCCPRVAEQMSNSHYLCYLWGVGLELVRTDTGGVERSSVELGVKSLMLKEEGLKARVKAREMRQLVRNACYPGGQSYSNLQKFYEDMKLLCSKANSCTT